MTTLTTDKQSNTLLDHQWINSDQATEYMNAIKDRTDNQLRDFCMCYRTFSKAKQKIYGPFYTRSTAHYSSTICRFSNETISL